MKQIKALQFRKYTNFSLTQQIRFPHEIKQTIIEKTNDPGPTTYTKYDTVGVM